ncbi:uncharacterized protein PAC_03540 [Phialocephala subalpina]|uniref:Heterokaryon incompatibility domain-containing protein n=1 Tax=Phialocephala subalpina TaxID=576137 RepID=A0A1L7WLM3_9HELO|nr:uncharacterized protein PAC_03540 [Phialocephala subalpina]
MEALVEYNAAQTFKYEPITESDGIRLLVLHPAENEAAEIRCSLIITALSKCEYEVIDHYTALSYVWGDASNIKPIEVDGAQVEITANLHDALLYIRDQSRPIHLWLMRYAYMSIDTERNTAET